MKPDATGYLTIEVKRRDCFLDVGTQFVPRIALRENALREALRAKPAVGLLRYFKDDLVHFLEFKRSRG